MTTRTPVNWMLGRGKERRKNEVDTVDVLSLYDAQERRVKRDRRVEENDTITFNITTRKKERKK